MRQKLNVRGQSESLPQICLLPYTGIRWRCELRFTTLKGNFPVLATAWTDAGVFDEASQANLIEWLIASGVHGLVMNANASEAHTMSDTEQTEVLEYNFRRVQDRVPIVVTVSHYSAEVALEKARHAENLGAACLMSMPPFFGRWGTDLVGVRSYFQKLCSAVTIPVMIQDHEISSISMSPEFLSTMAREFENIRYLKVEFTQSPWKIERILAEAGGALDGIFGGTAGLHFIDEYERGCCGTMPACFMPSVFNRVFELLESNGVKQAMEFFLPYIPLITFQLRMADRCLWKIILKYLRVIRSQRIGPRPRLLG